jgi:CRP/FNR family transcriptional regulator, anaerobic regulatory protein
MEQFREFVKQRIDVTEEELNDIVSRYQVRKIKKKEYFLRAGEVCHHEAYVISGLFKSFYVTADGIEHILQFAIEDWWIGDIASFNYQEPALQNIQALENSVVLTLSKNFTKIIPSSRNSPGLWHNVRKSHRSTVLSRA